LDAKAPRKVYFFLEKKDLSKMVGVAKDATSKSMKYAYA
jgi:hypothetical protein